MQTTNAPAPVEELHLGLLPKQQQVLVALTDGSVIKLSDIEHMHPGSLSEELMIKWIEVADAGSHQALFFGNKSKLRVGEVFSYWVYDRDGYHDYRSFPVVESITLAYQMPDELDLLTEIEATTTIVVTTHFGTFRLTEIATSGISSFVNVTVCAEPKQNLLETCRRSALYSCRNLARGRELIFADSKNVWSLGRITSIQILQAES
jgi:hypothetical protein